MAKPERRAGVFVRPARVQGSRRLELVDEPVQPLGVNVQVDDCGAELTEHTARVPPLGPRPGETLQQHHDARAFLAQLRELRLDQLDPMRLCRTSGRLHSLLPETLACPVDVLEKRPDLGFPVPDCALVRFWSRLFRLNLVPVLLDTLRKPPDLLRSSLFPMQAHLVAVEPFADSARKAGAGAMAANSRRP